MGGFRLPRGHGNLSEVLPAERTGLVREGLALLQQSTRRLFPEAADRVLANTSDARGVGGKPADGETKAENPATKERS